MGDRMDSKMIYNIIEAIHSAVELSLTFLFFERIFDEKYRGKKHYYIGMYFILLVFFALAGIVLPSALTRFVFTMLVLLVIIFSLYKATAVQAFFASVYYMLLVAVTETFYVTMALALGFGLPDETLAQGPRRITAMIVTKIINFWLIIYSSYVYKKKYRNIPAVYLVQIILMPFLSVVIMGVLYMDGFKSAVDTVSYIITVLGLLYINFAVFDYFETYDNRVRLAALERVMELENDNYKALINSYSEIRSIRHDMVNQTAVLNDLIAKKNYSGAEEYMKKLYETVDEASSVYYTGDSAVDSIINIKAGVAKSKGIKFIVQIQQSAINTDALSLCRILGNALDNAIEACEKVENDEKYIMLAMRSKDNSLFIKIDNSSLPVDTDKLITTKNDKRLHGLGMISIRRTLSKINGTMTCMYDDGCFSVRIVIVNDI